MKLFISYARVDTAIIQDLVAKLRLGGHEPWFDHALHAGDDWQAELLAQIKACDVLVYALTDASVQSEWCVWEYAQAVELGKRVLPVLLQKGMTVPEFIDHLHYADFSAGVTADSVAYLLGSLTKLAQKVSKKRAPDAAEQPSGAPANADVDDLYDDALAITREHNGVSIRLLARRLNIGEKRAGQIVDALEAQRVVGTYPGGGKLRPCLKC